MEYEMMSGEIREGEREQYVKYLLSCVLCLCMREVTPAIVTSGQLDTLGAGSFQINKVGNPLVANRSVFFIVFN